MITGKQINLINLIITDLTFINAMFQGVKQIIQVIVSQFYLQVFCQFCYLYRFRLLGTWVKLSPLMKTLPLSRVHFHLMLLLSLPLDFESVFCRVSIYVISRKFFWLLF